MEIHEDFMKTLGKDSPSYSIVKNEQQSLRGGESVENDGWSGRTKDATADENVMVEHNTLQKAVLKAQRILQTSF